ncbi:MAG: hypothetical protein BWX92_01005 [Deltaproteobacteria bacterium ADurb.Bin135]|jgi:hypothetical protein|nr:MAG: hypothetical protein BWX92_01005 [Deltaproteobacteria bacterium ADurb.Bin135]
MTKEKLLMITRELLKTDNRLDFLLKLEQEEFEMLVASIRNRLQQTEKNQ